MEGDDRDGPRHLVQFPESLPSEIEANVPYPVENYPDWTTTPYTEIDIPHDFPDFINLPDPTVEPAYYAAAVDTIRVTNDYFTSHHYSASSVTKAQVQFTREQWPFLTEEDGSEVMLYPARAFPMPPDPRTFYVQESEGDPLNAQHISLWIIACERVIDMEDSEWELWLSYTRQSLDNKRKLSEDGDDSSWMIAIFVRFLVWHELVHGTTGRAKAFREEQPTADQLEAFFAHKDSGEDSEATLVELCHQFPHARNAQMLVYRIERFATLIPQRSLTTETGAIDPVESQYARKLDPTKEGIALAVASLLKNVGSSVSIGELEERYWPSVENSRLIINELNTIARPDVTTGRSILVAHGTPSHTEIEATFNGTDYLNGFTLAEIAQRFQNRVWSLANFRSGLTGFTYFDDNGDDSDDGPRFYPLYMDEESHFLSPEESIAFRNRERIRMWDPDRIDQDYRWDRTLMRYIPRSERMQLIDNTGAEGSPTEVASSPGGSPPSIEAHVLHVPVTTVETVPMLPREPRATLQIGVITTMETTPSETPSIAAIAADVASSTPVVESSSPSGTGSSKRAATELPEAERAAKRGRKNPKIRCSGRTQKGLRCKKSTDQEGEEAEWYCSIHARG